MIDLENLKYPKGIYTDIRVENVRKTVIQRVDGRLSDVRRRTQQGAFIRMFNGSRWYMSGFSSLDRIQDEIHQLETLVRQSPQNEEALYSFMDSLSITTGQMPLQSDCPVFSMDVSEKQKKMEVWERTLLESSFRVQNELFYTDFVVEKQMLNSCGGHVGYAKQGSGLWVSAQFQRHSRVFKDRYVYAESSFENLEKRSENIRDEVAISELFLKESEPVKAGTYPVILAPSAAGLFAHESVGHLSEADFGGAPVELKSRMTIVDDGTQEGWGYTPYDDEGTPAQRTVLIGPGQPCQKMHSQETAWKSGEKSTGNARAMDFSFEPIVRMTNTMILPGENTFEEMKANTKEGLFVESVSGGFGMETFTLTPLRCWQIKDGSVVGPVSATVITGRVDHALAQVAMVGNEIECHGMVKGGCGKMDQFPLDVGFGGPHIKVDGLEVW